MNEVLTTAEVEQLLLDLEKWKVEDGKLYRVYEFRNFIQAWGFMTSCALEAEKLNHHPDWSNSYRKVTVILFTHDQQALTQKDATLAKKMETLAQFFA